jgi:stage IV sporulation protein FB
MTIFKKYPIEISVYSAALVVLLCALGSTFGNMGLAMLFAALHEVGHYAVLAASGAKPGKICLTAAGVRMERGAELGVSLKQEVWIAAAGPICSLVLAAICFALLAARGFASAALLGNSPGWTGVLVNGVWMNAGFALFNLLPIRQLDGGRMLYYGLCQRKPEEKAESLTQAASIFCLLLLLTCAVGYSIGHEPSWSLWMVLVYLAMEC